MPDITHSQIGPLEYEVKVVLSRAEVDSEVNKYCEEIKNHVQMNGFRKGSAPISVIKQKFAEPIKTEVSSRIINSKTEEAIKQVGLKITGNPTLLEKYRAERPRKWLGDFKLDGGFVYAVSLEVEPTLELSGYTGLTVKVDLPKPEEWIASRIAELQNQFAERTQVLRPIQLGDEVALDFITSIGGVAVEDGAESWRTIKIGAGEIAPDFDKNLIGHVADEEVSFAIEFPANYQAAQIAGKTVDFKVKIHTITEVNLHPVDDELAQKAVYENVEQMRSELAAKADADFVQPRKARILEGIMKEILSKHEFEVPRCWVEAEMKVVAFRFGIRTLPTDPTELNNLRDLAKQSVKQNFIFDRIYAQEESIRLTGDEITARLDEEAKRYGKTGAEFLGMLKTNGNYEGFISFAEQQKAVEFLINNNTIQQ